MPLNYSYLCIVDKGNENLRPRHGKLFPILAKNIFLGRAQKIGLKIGTREIINYSLLTIKNFDIMALFVLSKTLMNVSIGLIVNHLPEMNVWKY